MKTDWNVITEGILINSLKEGCTYNEIAIKLNRSSNSVRLKANRLGYKSEDFKKHIKTFCLQCSVEYKGDKDSKFCSKSCSATYTNKNRVLSKLTKNKISESLKSVSTKITKLCSVCQKVLKHCNKTGKCIKCLGKDPAHRLTLSRAMKGKVGGYRVKGGNPQHKGGYYCNIWMDSSWELALAERLDTLGVNWERGSKIYLPWVDDLSVSHKYYPDFFLPDFDTYIEIKGYWLEKTRVKMKKVQEQNDIKLIMLESIKSIKEFILQ